MSEKSPFASPGSAADLEEGAALTPKFDADGLVTCVATDVASGDVLMVAHMNAEALAKTIATGEAWYFSRSRRALWRKGETWRRGWDAFSWSARQKRGPVVRSLLLLC